MIVNNWLKFGFDIHHWSISYLRWLQDHIGMLSHLDFGYFDLVNLLDQVKHGSQYSGSKTTLPIFTPDMPRTNTAIPFFRVWPQIVWSMIIITLLLAKLYNYCSDFGSSRAPVFQGVWVVTCTILLCLQILRCNQFAVLSLKKDMMTFMIFRGCTIRKWTRKLLGKSIWLRKSRKW